jgi:hypothetical protein
MDYSLFNAMLPSVKEQVALLIPYVNRFLPQLSVRYHANRAKSLATALEKLSNWDSGTPQQITNAQAVFVWLGDVKTTLEFYQLIVEDRQKASGGQGISIWLDLHTLSMELDSSAFQYPKDRVGVYVAHGLNLTANCWEEERTVLEAREHSKEQGVFLASLEALALYAVAAPRLFHSQHYSDGLPYLTLAGIRSPYPLASRPDHTPSAAWGADDRDVVDFSIVPTDVTLPYLASPTLRGVSRG